jgi:threonine aldolase
VQTNIVIFDIRKSGRSASELLKTLAQRGVLAVPVDNERVRMVTHLDVNRDDVERAGNIVREVLQR